MKYELSEYCVRYIANERGHTVEVTNENGGIKVSVGGDEFGCVQFQSHGLYRTDVNWDWLLSVYAESYKMIPPNK